VSKATKTADKNIDFILKQAGERVEGDEEAQPTLESFFFLGHLSFLCGEDLTE
jgi:hypothetical protein